MPNPRAILIGGTKHVLATMAAGVFLLAMMSAVDVAQMYRQAKRER
jgi:hypothetical protein